MLPYFKRICDGVEALPRNWVECGIFLYDEHIPVEYALVQKDGQWGIQDVTIDGVSIVGNYHNQFHKVILAQSFDALLKKMRLQSQATRTNPP